MTEVSPILHRADPSAQAIDPENKAMNQRLMSNWSYIACMAHLLLVLTHTLVLCIWDSNMQCRAWCFHYVLRILCKACSWLWHESGLWVYVIYLPPWLLNPKTIRTKPECRILQFLLHMSQTHLDLKWLVGFQIVLCHQVAHFAPKLITEWLVVIKSWNNFSTVSQWELYNQPRKLSSIFVVKICLLIKLPQLYTISQLKMKCTITPLKIFR